MNRGSIPFDERLDPQRLLETLVDVLRRAHAKNVSVSVDRVRFTGGVFRAVSNWNVLVPFGSGELIINRPNRRLEYRVSFRQLALFLVAFSFLGGVFMLAAQAPPHMFLVWSAMVWLWLGGMNVLIGRVRFKSFLRDAIERAGTTDGG